MNKYIGILSAIFIFAGCSMKDVTKPIVKYTIDDDTRIVKVINQSDSILKITAFKAPSYMNTSNIWYQKQNYETNSYLYSEWNENFTSLIERNIANSIYESALFKSSFTKYSKIKADILLEGEIVEAIQKVKNNGKSVVSFKVRLYLIKQENNENLGLKEFSYEQECSTIDAIGTIEAYNKIVKNLNKDVIAWLKILVTKN